MAERGNTKHGQHLDDKMQQETQGMVKGNQPAHVEEWRETEPFPDDTDTAEVQDAVTPGPEAGGAETGEAENEGTSRE
ncbi:MULTISPECIES: hypothetical protein [unclassified Arthrobacter]|uniref:hypothetical protein n=1 Tax=unclassified Arthrobacter TaxID=235627 RepID=UPI001F209386|nr:hypothetical protein [Arthrobacter sp. FW305-BF8]UKA56191.1 hypothetical protein LFT45_09945 [Arthrobacter sp. FW305-BF8]